MTDNKSPLLTEAARRALSTYLDNESEEIITRARAVARQRTGEETIDVQDIIPAIPSSTSIYEPRIEFEKYVEYQRRRRRTILGLASIYSATLTVAGVLLAIYFQFKEQIDRTALMSLAVAGVGVIFGSVTIFYSRYLREREVDARREQISADLSRARDHRPYDSYLRSWNELEITLRLLAEEQLGSETSPIGLREVATKLVDKGAIDAEDANLLLHFLRLRNNLVHSPTPALSDDLLLEQIADMQDLRKKLEGAL